MRKIEQILQSFQEHPEDPLKGFRPSDLARAFYEVRFDNNQFNNLAGVIAGWHEKVNTVSHSGLTGTELAMANLASVVAMADSDYFEANGKEPEDTFFGIYSKKNIPTADMLSRFRGPSIQRLCEYYGISKPELCERVSEIERKYNLRTMN